MENLKNFIKKHGDPTLPEDYSRRLEHTITKVIKEMIVELDQEEIPVNLRVHSKTRVMDGILIQVTSKVDKPIRPPIIRIFMTSTWAYSLLHGHNYRNGEMAMMGLFTYILYHGDDPTSVGGGILDWNLNLGTLKNPDAIYGLLDDPIAHHTTVKEYFGNSKEEVTFITVKLNDHRS